MSCFSFYLFSFLFCKIREQKGGTGPAQGEGLAPVGGGRWQGKEEIWCKKCVHIHVNAKIMLIESVP
jgi:hypothetical protein